MRRVRFVIALPLLTLAFATTVGAQADTPPLTAMETAVACSPPPSFTGPPANALHVIGAQDSIPRTLFGARDLLVVDGGTKTGVQLGQRFFIRRTNHFGNSDDHFANGARTAGWISVVAVNESTAIAVVDHVCGAILQSDYLEPFVAPVVPEGADRDETPGEPDFTSLGHIVVGNEQREAVGAGDFALIDRGTEQGVAPGARFSVYRDIGVPGMPLASIGEAVIISAGQTMALARITRARDAVLSGDYVALRR
jgi:hypothetical protein